MSLHFIHALHNAAVPLTAERAEEMLRATAAEDV